MTSRISFSKLTLDEFRKLAWLTAIQLLGFGIMIPVRVLITMASHANAVEKYDQQENFLMEFCYVAGLGRSENTVCILLAGAFVALCVFCYLHSSVKLDFFHSLPIRRERLFAIKYLAGTLTFVTAYVTSQILTVLVGMVYGAVNARIVYEMFVASIQGILFFLCSFSGTLIAVMLTGKTLTSVFAVAVLAAYAPLIMVIGKAYEACFLHNVLDSGELFGNGWGNYASPWTFCMTMMNRYGNNAEKVFTGPDAQMPGIAEMCQLVAVAVLCSLAALALYRIRKSEAAGQALAFGKTEGVIKILLAVPGSLLAMVLAWELFESMTLTVLFLVLTAVVCCMIMEFIYRWDIHQILARRRHIVITFAAALAVFLGFRYDIAGVNSYLPEKEEIASMAVCDNNLRYSATAIWNRDGYSGGYSRQAIEEKLTNLETDQFDKLYQLAQSGIANTRGSDSEQDVMLVYMKFRLKNGKEVYRNYWADLSLLFECMDELLVDEAMRAEYFNIVSWTKDTVKGMEGSCWLPENTVLSFMQNEREADPELKKAQENAQTESLSDEGVATQEIEYENPLTSIILSTGDLWKIVQAYQKDLAGMSYEEYFYTHGNLYFSDTEHYYSLGNYAVGENFTETIKLLEELWPKYEID